MNFRQYDQKWFFLENKKDIKRLTKLFSLNKSYKPILLYTFIDPDEGLSGLVLGNIFLQDNEAYIEKEIFEENLYLVRYQEFKNFTLKEVEEKKIDKIKNTNLVKTLIYDNYYFDLWNVIITRDDKKLDPYRDELIIDKVKLVIIDQNKNKEHVWVNLLEKINDEDYLVLINEDIKKFDINKDEELKVKYVERPNFQGLIFLNKDQEDTK